MSNAPHCPISHNGSRQSSQPWAVDVTHIPPVHDLKSVINAVNVINNIVQHITRGTPQINNIGTPPVRPPTVDYKRLTWQEVSRTYQEQEVVNPDDKTQRIKIRTLSSVHWIEQTSGHQLTYTGA